MSRQRSFVERVRMIGRSNLSDTVCVLACAPSFCLPPTLSHNWRFWCLEFGASPDFEPIRKRLLAIMDSKERIPYVAKHGRYYYNFWRDAKNVRGLWRRTTLAEFKKVEPVWETVVDMDKLSDAEKENWVWKGYNVLYPKYDRCLVFLSRGGADAKVV